MSFELPNRDLRQHVAAMQKMRDDNVQDRAALQDRQQILLQARQELDEAIARVQRDMRVIDHSLTDLDSDIREGVTRLMLNEHHDMELRSQYEPIA